MKQVERTEADARTASLEAIALVRCALQGDDAGFVELITGTEDGMLLVAQTTRLCAYIIETACGDDWPKVTSMLASFVVEGADP